MEVVELHSSSNDLSSAPNSDAEGPYPNRLTSALSDSNTIVVSRATTAGGTYPLLSSKASNASPLAHERPASGAVKVRKPRKKKDETAVPAPEKEKKPRKARAAPGSGPASRKKIKTESMGTPVLSSAPLSTSVANTLTSHPSPFSSASTPTPSLEAAKVSQTGVSSERYSMPAPAHLQTAQPTTFQPPLHIQQQPPPSVSSVQHHSTPSQSASARPKPIFDPIRGILLERSAPTPPLAATTLSPPPQALYQPIASPAMPNVLNPSHPGFDGTHQPDTSRSPVPPTFTSAAESSVRADENAMDLDHPIASEKKSESVAAKPASKPRAKEQPPPLPTGSGLLSSSLFGGDTGTDSRSSSEKGPNIVLHIDLKNPDNKVINFARMAEEKYGFAALYPRQAAQKERLAKVAAAGAALERAGSGVKGGTSASDSADEDLSVDIDRDSDNDGDAVMSGVNGKGEVGNSGTDGPGPRKRRKRKDEYDADDPFVDDSEMLWEAQAAASKDGFFVYIGPLVPEGEKPAVERADGTVKRGRGRGRGGGPGSRGGRGGGHAAASHADGSGGRGGGAGSRGGGVTRKPRITKAERQQREMDKKQRDSMAVLAAKPPLVPA